MPTPESGSDKLRERIGSGERPAASRARVKYCEAHGEAPRPTRGAPGALVEEERRGDDALISAARVLCFYVPLACRAVPCASVTRSALAPRRV